MYCLLLIILISTVTKMKLLMLKCRNVGFSEVTVLTCFFLKSVSSVLPCDLQWADGDILTPLKNNFLMFSGFVGKWNCGFLFWERCVCNSSLPIAEKLGQISVSQTLSLHFPLPLLIGFDQNTAAVTALWRAGRMCMCLCVHMLGRYGARGGTGHSSCTSTNPECTCYFGQRKHRITQSLQSSLSLLLLLPSACASE